MKFRKKQVVIEAEQFLDGAPVPRGVCYCDQGNEGEDANAHLHAISTQKVLKLHHGDWILPESNGRNFYICKPDVFMATYEPVFP